MQLDILKNIGLTDGEVEVYQTLLEGGELSAGELIKKTALKRGDCYNKIYDLKRKGLIEEFSKNKKKFFRLEHPKKIEEIIENSYSEIQRTKKELGSVFSDILSNYNLTYNKPGVSIFEGEEGIKKVWWDSLSSKEIYTLGDLEFLATNFAKINKNYIRERIKKGITKKAVTNSSEFNKNYLEKNKDELTETRLIKDLPIDFSSTIMQIYDGKISYATLKGKSLIGIIIDDKYIFEMHKNLFEFMWKTLECNN